MFNSYLDKYIDQAMKELLDKLSSNEDFNQEDIEPFINEKVNFLEKNKVIDFHDKEIIKHTLWLFCVDSGFVDEDIKIEELPQ